MLWNQWYLIQFLTKVSYYKNYLYQKYCIRVFWFIITFFSISEARNDLTICRLTDCSASVAGGKEVLLFCEKVTKDDIEVRFFQEDANGKVSKKVQHRRIYFNFYLPFFLLIISIKIDLWSTIFYEILQDVLGDLSLL